MPVTAYPPQMASVHSTMTPPPAQAGGGGGLVGFVSQILDAVDARQILRQLGQYRLRGRKGYSLDALWRAYLVTFILNLPHTNGLIRCLQQYPELRRLCGFEQLPHRT